MKCCYHLFILTAHTAVRKIILLCIRFFCETNFSCSLILIELSILGADCVSQLPHMYSQPFCYLQKFILSMLDLL